ncbi:UNVERIFIED_CONTAM: hypothetical protein PYX00_007063 [Menopon gallinae]|uniref:Uncharacterized protein n=1 Tax=Menopon gallinae TaxID=328185 RepID=A0AAW2HHC5_9NEOP
MGIRREMAREKESEDGILWHSGRDTTANGLRNLCTSAARTRRKLRIQMDGWKRKPLPCITTGGAFNWTSQRALKDFSTHYFVHDLYHRYCPVRYDGRGRSESSVVLGCEMHECDCSLVEVFASRSCRVQ